MDTSIITSFFKKAAKNLAVGVAGAIESGDNTRLVPAIAPIPIDAVDMSYGKTNAIQQEPNEKEKEYKDVVVEAIKEIAQQRNLPYEKKPEVALATGGLVKRETIAKVGEKEPEIVQPVKDYGETVEEIYRQGAALIIGSSLGFLKTLPPSPAKGSVLEEANRLKSIFGLGEVPKPRQVIGLKAPLVWWGGKKQTATGAPKTKTTDQTPEKSNRSFMGNPLRGLKNLKKVGKKGLKFLKGKAGKVGKGIRKVAASGTKLVKGAKKASMALLKKGSKKIAAKVGGKAIAKVGAKALGKGLLKKIPFVGLGAGLLFAGQRLMAGDMKGAMLEAASGIAGTIPGVGTAISVGLDATLAAKDMGVLPDQKKAENQVGAAPVPDPSKDMYGRPIILNPPTMKAWKKAVNRAAKDGINLPMSVTSSYRSPEQQQALINAAESGDENAINPAPVGQSPHGQGWAIDIDYYSKANEWMRDKGKKFGFAWQGEGDPVHFDYLNNEKNTKWLQPGKNKWIPNIDDPVGKPSSGAVKTASGTGSAISSPSGSGSKETLNNEPVTQGSTDASGNVVSAPRIVPVNLPPKEIIVYKWMHEGDIQDSIDAIDPMGKGVKYVLKYEK